MLAQYKRVSVLKSDMDAENGYALVYACANDWWMLFPRKIESAWIISRKESVDDSVYESL